jgi:hypothetical protein
LGSSLILISVFGVQTLYTMFRAQADWTLILLSASSCESAASLAEKNAAARPVQLAHCLLLLLIIN